MGLLEDAIREHLDLKRKHGAPEQELERQEVEALGPARREPAPEDAEAGEAPVEGDAAPGGGAAVAEPEPEAPLEVPFGEEPDAGTEPAAVAEPDPEPEAVVEEEPFAEPEAAVELEPQAVDPELPPDPPLEPNSAVDHDLPPDPEAASPYSSTADQPTEFFDVEEAIRAEDTDRPGDTPARGFPAQQPDEDEPAADPAAEGDEDADVLEDTPDFLQDAPEHDRLWFEQKPPRDFDFD